MEARATFEAASFGRSLVAGLAVIAAICLVVVGAYMVKGSLGGGSAATQSQAVHAAPGTVLRQDDPKLATGISANPDEGRSTGHRELP